MHYIYLPKWDRFSCGHERFMINHGSRSRDSHKLNADSFCAAPNCRLMLLKSDRISWSIFPYICCLRPVLSGSRTSDSCKIWICVWLLQLWSGALLMSSSIPLCDQSTILTSGFDCCEKRNPCTLWQQSSPMPILTRPLQYLYWHS